MASKLTNNRIDYSKYQTFGWYTVYSVVIKMMALVDILAKQLYQYTNQCPRPLMAKAHESQGEPGCSHPGIISEVLQSSSWHW